jgi:glycerol-3-phosphate acyltransferase PlsY
MIEVAVAALSGYLLGSIPVGLLVGRYVRGVDVREYGSGKTGFTNSLRVLGLRRALPVFLGDFGKGAIAASLPLLYSDESWARAAGGLAAVAGHVWPVFAGFRGGRGVLAGFGAMVALSPVAALLAVPVAALVLLLTRYMSAMSIAGCLGGIITFAAFAALDLHPWAYAAGALVGCSLVIVLHRDNIARLLAGTEPRIGHGGGRRATA